MKRPDDFLSSLDKCWEDFSNAWKKARAKASEKSIHDLRVGTRRLIAALELNRAVSRNIQIPKLQRRFKKILKQMGSLRDIQVQLETLSAIRQAAPILEFERSLKRRERRETTEIHMALKRGEKKRLARGIDDVREHFVRLHARSGDERIQSAVERYLKARRNDFMRARKRFKPEDGETLHQMRIALKKLRYAVEASQPVMGDTARELARSMHEFQQLMGDTRDIELLASRLEKWSSKRGNKIAVVPALESLEEKRMELIRKIVRSSAALDNILPEERVKPAIEKTHAVATPGGDSIAASDESKPRQGSRATAD
jgi:CHAD domain-containing protein